MKETLGADCNVPAMPFLVAGRIKPKREIRHQLMQIIITCHFIYFLLLLLMSYATLVDILKQEMCLIANNTIHKKSFSVETNVIHLWNN
jgi:hypothetical protein